MFMTKCVSKEAQQRSFPMDEYGSIGYTLHRERALSLVRFQVVVLFAAPAAKYLRAA
jgi:hypothetical protein